MRVITGGRIFALDQGETTHIDAYGVNTTGVVVGTATTVMNRDFTAREWRAVRWDVGVLSFLDSAFPPGDGQGAVGGVAFATNESGQIVGTSSACYSTVCRSAAVVWTGTTVTDLNTVLDSSGAGYTVISGHDINDRGQVLAEALDGSGNLRPVILTPVPEPHTYALMLVGLAAVLGGSRRGRR